MTESVEEPKQKKNFLRKRLGKVLFVIGFIIVAFSILSTIPIFVLPSRTSDASMNVGVGLGAILAIIGLFAALFPDGQSEEGAWIMMMSPYAGNN